MIKLVGDFETTVYNGQESTEVWASAIVRLYSEHVIVDNEMYTTWDRLVMLNDDVVIYYHNLKFDGHFWVDFFICNGFNLAYDDENKCFIERDKMENGDFQYTISQMGQWYRIVVKTKFGKYVEIRDSYKLLPFSVKQLSSKFETKHKKLDIEYTGVRHAGGVITAREAEYIKNDVLVVKESLEKFFEIGEGLTIGSCCLSQYKKTVPRLDFDEMYPDLTAYKINPEIYGCENADKYIRKTYRGGWCYLKPELSGKILGGGYTLDVNSLYPYEMVSKIYPVGNPHFFEGVPPHWDYDKYYFVTVRCQFYLKNGYLPTIQIKNNFLYRGNEYLITSDYYDERTGEYYDKIIGDDGLLQSVTVTLHLTSVDFDLFLKHYDVKNLEYLHGCWFNTSAGMFDSYIYKYRDMKENASNVVIRTIAKLMSNNLYGKMATGSNNSFKLCYMDNGIIQYKNIFSDTGKSVYIPVGSAITSYARNDIINAAQANYDNFVYSDTDSLHLLGNVDNAIGVQIHESEYGYYKCENIWQRGYFLRQKTYIEQGDEFIFKCSGMPERCKKLFERSVRGDVVELDKLTDDELKFISKKRDIDDLKIGLEIPGKLVQKRIPGGVVLKETPYVLSE